MDSRIIYKATDNITSSLNTLKELVIFLDLAEEKKILDCLDGAITEIDLFKSFFEIYK